MPGKFRWTAIPLVACAVVLIAGCSPAGRLMREHLQSRPSTENLSVVIVGDQLSLASATDGTSWWGDLKPMLADYFDATVTIVDVSREGMTFSRATRYTDEDILSFRPDLVFVMLGAEDALRGGVSMADHKRYMDSFMKNLETNGVMAVFVSAPGVGDLEPGDFRLQILDGYNDSLENTASYYFFPYFDLTYEVRGILYSDVDRFHNLFISALELSPEGKQFVADFVFRRMVRLLEKQ